MLRGRIQSSVGRTAVAIAVSTLCVTGTSHAQSAYIGASALADISRFGTTGGGNGETFGGAIRAGTSITDRWGLDVEFARTGTLEEENSFDIIPLLAAGAGVATGSFTFTGVGSAPTIAGALPNLRIGPGGFRTTTTQQFATLTAMPWIRQAVGSRAEIVYLGGIALVRTERTSSFGFGGILPLFDGRGDGQEFITYGWGPALGLDVRVFMTDSLRLVPGVRLLVVDEAGRSGWLTRPSLGVQWSF